MNKKHKDYKKYIKLQREYDDTSMQIRNLPWIELDKPYQHGWEIYYKCIHPDKNVRFIFNTIYKECAWRTSNVQFVKNIRKGIYTAKLKRKSIDLHPELHKLDTKEYYKLPEHLKEFFDKVHHSWKANVFVYKFNLKRSHYILKVRPYYITHKREIDPNLISKREQLRNELYKYWRLEPGYGNYPKSNGRVTQRDDIRKFINGTIDDIENKKIGKEYYW